MGVDEAAAWLIVTVWFGSPVTLNVTVAVRAVVAVLAAMVSVTVPLFVPLDAESVTHVAELVTIHARLDVMAIACVPPAAGCVTVVGAMVSVGLVPVWSTATVCVNEPAVKVRGAVRAAAPV